MQPIKTPKAMATEEEMKAAMLTDYQDKFDAFEKIAFELHKLGETDIEMQVIKKMSGLKLMINYCKGVSLTEM
jgi:hypothetical protein